MYVFGSCGVGVMSSVKGSLVQLRKRALEILVSNGIPRQFAQLRVNEANQAQLRSILKDAPADTVHSSPSPVIASDAPSSDSGFTLPASVSEYMRARNSKAPLTPDELKHINSFFPVVENDDIDSSNTDSLVKSKKKPKVMTSFQVDPDILERFRKIAEREDRTLAAVFRRALEFYLLKGGV
mgnify:CR=1 FL=1